MVTSFLKDISFGSNLMNSSSYVTDTEFAVEEPVKIRIRPAKCDGFGIQILDDI